MTELRKTIKCSNCGLESAFSIGSEFVVNELTIYAKCSRCGNSLQINFTIVEPSNSEGSTIAEEGEGEKTINLEEELFAPDMLSNEDDIRDIIEGA